jgi:hypothetical protein
MTDANRPEPTEELKARALFVEILPQGTPLLRVQPTLYQNSIFFGKPLLNRFDSPRRFGVLYTGIDKFVAFRETLFHGERDNLMLTKNKEGIFTKSRLNDSSMVKLLANRELRLVKAYNSNGDNALAENGIDESISKSVDRDYTQMWSLFYWEHDDRADGIIYRSHLDPSRLCVALYSDRVEYVLFVEPIDKLIGDGFQDDLGQIIDNYKIGINKEE